MLTKFDNVIGSNRRGKCGSKRLKLADFAVRAFFLCHRKWDSFCNRFVLDKFGTNCQKNVSSQQKNNHSQTPYKVVKSAYAISICICCIMCPTMSLIATILFKDTKDFGTWIQTWAMNFPMAILYQMFYCGPLVRFIFRIIFEKKDK